MLLSLTSVYYVLALTLILQDDTSDFDDLAIVVAVAFTFIRVRLRDKKPRAPDFISINPLKK